jgi:hypothetical protein
LGFDNLFQIQEPFGSIPKAMSHYKLSFTFKVLVFESDSSKRRVSWSDPSCQFHQKGVALSLGHKNLQIQELAIIVGIYHTQGQSTKLS